MATRKSSVPAKRERPAVARKHIVPGRAEAEQPTTETVAPAGVESSSAVAKPAGKLKLVRDSFTIPSDEYAALAALKARMLQLGRASKKSELIRAGIAALVHMSDKALKAAVERVPSVKTGRPAKSKS